MHSAFVCLGDGLSPNRCCQHYVSWCRSTIVRACAGMVITTFRCCMYTRQKYILVPFGLVQIPCWMACTFKPIWYIWKNIYGSSEFYSHYNSTGFNMTQRSADGEIITPFNIICGIISKHNFWILNFISSLFRSFFWKHSFWVAKLALGSTRMLIMW